MTVLPNAVRRHLEAWFGGWNEQAFGTVVVASDHRTSPGWDGRAIPMVGVANDDWAVLSVPPSEVESVRRHLNGAPVSDIASTLKLINGVFRWCLEPPAGDDVGDWVPRDDPRVPEWLLPFNGDVLIYWDDHGNYGAGVGLKKHNAYGQEIAVVTEQSLRGRGIGRALVETAARRVLADGAVPTYIHLVENIASAKLAEGAGFPDRGWRYLASPNVS